MDKENERAMVDLYNQETDELKSNFDIIELARIIHKHFQYLKSDWEEYTKSDLALAYAIKWNGYRKERDTARELATTIKSVIWEEFENETIRIKDLHSCINDIVRSKYGVDLGVVNNG